MDVRVDRELCIGSGRCVWAAPEVFAQADDGLVVLLQPAPPERLANRVAEAERMCPAEAILVDDPGNAD